MLVFADGYKVEIEALRSAGDQEVLCSVRPEEFVICTGSEEGIRGTVKESTYLGLNTHYNIETDAGETVEIVEESSLEDELKEGQQVVLQVKREKINVFNQAGDTNLIRSEAYEKQ
jgi:iron(III) transport system ATP-binding protein